MDKNVAVTSCFFTSKEKHNLFRKKKPFKFEFLHKIDNMGLEGEGVIKQDNKLFVQMNHLYDISLKSEHCGDSLRYFLSFSKQH